MSLDIVLKGLSRPAVTVIALLLVASVGLFDSMTGPGYSLSAFYLLPVVLTAWYAGRGYAILISVASAAAWLAAGITGRMYHEHTLVLLWNDMMELCLFLFAAYVISALRGRLECEEELARTDQLTGIANRRRFGELADAEIRRLLSAASSGGSSFRPERRCYYLAVRISSLSAILFRRGDNDRTGVNGQGSAPRVYRGICFRRILPC